jgi:Fur family peroxide stress response transcriptional regulator
MNRETMQRALVLDAVRKLDHPTADDVYGEICAAYPAVSRATVYRNLGLLEGRGAIGRVRMFDSADRYDMTPRRHFHAQCSICKKVFDVRLDHLDALLGGIGETDGFLIEDYSILLTGVCPECRKEGKKTCPN